MAAIFAFTCQSCGEVHEGSPSYGYNEPRLYSQLNEAQKLDATLTADKCIITLDGQTDRFIRVVLEVPIHGAQDPFLWGVWVSLSEANFTRHLDTWDAPVESDKYFGWFCNQLPYYPDTMSLKTSVRPRAGGQRPYIVLEPTEHLLSRHFHDGISIAEAQKVAEVMMHGSS